MSPSIERSSTFTVMEPGVMPEIALAIAQHLESLGLKVIYPGLPSHPGHERIKAMANAGS